MHEILTVFQVEGKGLPRYGIWNGAIFWVLILVPSHTPLLGQIIDWAREPAYLQVFVDTDDFDTTYLSTLQQAADEASEDTLKLKLLNDLAYYWHTRNLHRADSITRRGLKLAHARSQPYWLGKLQITQGAILLRAEQLDGAELVLRQAQTAVRETDLPFLHTQLGYVEERRGLLDKAAEEALQSLGLGERLGDQKAIAMAYSDLSNLFWKQAKYEEALDHGLRSIALFEERGIKDLDFSFTLYVVGNVYFTLKQYEHAFDYFDRSNAMAERYGFYNNLSDTYISLTDLYTEIGHFELAEEASYQAIRYAKLLDNAFLLMRSWLSVGKLQNLMGEPRKALQSLQTCLEVATPDFGDEFFLHQAYEELGKARASTGDYEGAYEAFQRYDKLKDNIFTAEADRRVSELQTRFEVAGKEATISAQEQAIRQGNRIQLLTGGLLLLVLVVLGGLSRNFLHNKKVNRKLESLNRDLAAKNAELDQRNADKELLLKEIHHRVKNNLEVVSSLLALQSARVTDRDVQAAMLASRNRMRSMGIIHQKLYQGENLAAIEMKDYFHHLGEGILDSFEAGDRVALVCDMPELELDVEEAIPIGLIVNELLTNSLKYAFPDGRPGQVTISLNQGPGHTLELQVADNGIGKPPGGETTGTGFGTQLVALLTRQLNGSIREEVENGTRVQFRFEPNA